MFGSTLKILSIVPWPISDLCLKTQTGPARADPRMLALVGGFWLWSEGSEMYPLENRVTNVNQASEIYLSLALKALLHWSPCCSLPVLHRWMLISTTSTAIVALPALSSSADVGAPSVHPH